MASFFNYDNQVFSSINKMVDMLVLSIIYVLICLPIVTIGPATTALYYTIVKNIRRERGYPFREFFKSFKNNFKQGLILTLIFVAIYLVLFFDINFTATELKGMQRNIFTGIFIGLTILVISINLYVFPYLSRFEVKLKQLFKNSFFLSIRHFPSTILMFIIVVLGFLASLTIPPLIMIMPGIVILLQSFLVERIFKKYMPDKSEDNYEQGVDEWYLE